MSKHGAEVKRQRKKYEAPAVIESAAIGPTVPPIPREQWLMYIDQAPMFLGMVFPPEAQPMLEDLLARAKTAKSLSVLIDDRIVVVRAEITG